MASDPLAAMIAALDTRDQAEDQRRARSARTPDMNNPWKPVPVRAERRTQRSYADPTGETAIGNTKRKR